MEGGSGNRFKKKKTFVFFFVFFFLFFSMHKKGQRRFISLFGEFDVVFRRQLVWFHNTAVGLKLEQATRFVIGYVRIHSQHVFCNKRRNRGQQKRRSMERPTRPAGEDGRFASEATGLCSPSCGPTSSNEEALGAAQLLRIALLQQALEEKEQPPQ